MNLVNLRNKSMNANFLNLKADSMAMSNQTQQPRSNQSTGKNLGPKPHIRVQADVASTKPVVLSGRNIHKTYKTCGLEVPVLCGVDLSVRTGQFAAIVGQSGSGKSTLLHLLGTLDRPDKGEIFFNGKRIDNLQSRERDQLRNNDVGLIFQFYHLLPELNALENVLVPYMIRFGVFNYFLNRRQYIERAKHLLDLVGLGGRLKHRPNQLSGGERQRTAIARALITEPRLLLADEPTGNLDSKSGGEVLTLLNRLSEDENLTIVMVTHDDSIATKADTIIRLAEGKVVT